jgi:hypothetical protein
MTTSSPTRLPTSGNIVVEQIVGVQSAVQTSSVSVDIPTREPTSISSSSANIVATGSPTVAQTVEVQSPTGAPTQELKIVEVRSDLTLNAASDFDADAYLSALQLPAGSSVSEVSFSVTVKYAFNPAPSEQQAKKAFALSLGVAESEVTIAIGRRLQTTSYTRRLAPVEVTATVLTSNAEDADLAREAAASTDAVTQAVEATMDQKVESTLAEPPTTSATVTVSVETSAEQAARVVEEVAQLDPEIIAAAAGATSASPTQTAVKNVLTTTPAPTTPAMTTTTSAGNVDGIVPPKPKDQAKPKDQSEGVRGEIDDEEEASSAIGQFVTMKLMFSVVLTSMLTSMLIR